MRTDYLKRIIESTDRPFREVRRMAQAIEAYCAAVEDDDPGDDDARIMPRVERIKQLSRELAKLAQEVSQ